MYTKTLITALIISALCLSLSTSKAAAVACAKSGTVGSVTLTGTNCALPSALIGADSATTATDTVNTGAVTIPAGTSITLNAGDTLVFGSGGLNVSGSITKMGGTMVKGAIWVTDADSDRYYANGTAQFSATRPGTKVRLGWTTGNIDSSDVSACPAGQTMGCQYCLNGATANVTNATDPYSSCDTAPTACVNVCTRTQRTGMCNGAGACATSSVNVGSGQLCTGAGATTTGQCQAGYTCNGAGHCCYTDIYGEHCAW